MELTTTRWCFRFDPCKRFLGFFKTVRLPDDDFFLCFVVFGGSALDVAKWLVFCGCDSISPLTSDVKAALAPKASAPNPAFALPIMLPEKISTKFNMK